MRSVTLEAIRLLNRWSEYIFGKQIDVTNTTPSSTAKDEQTVPQIIPLFISSKKANPKDTFPKSSIWQKLKSAKLIRLPSYKGDAGEQLDIGTLCYNSENYQLALLWYWLAARQGHAEAQFLLGLLYEEGEIIGQDYAKAVRYFKRSAEQGFVLGQNNYAWMLIRGDGIEKNFEEGFRWYKLAAEQGFYKAQFVVGLAYFFGDWSSVAKQNFQEAVHWLRLSADQGDPDAQFNLGLMYLKGHGVSQDHEAGMDLIERASEHDHPAALYHLGLAYDLGDRVEPDDDYSNLNYEIAAEHGHSGARFGMTGDGSQNYRGN